MDRDVTLVSEQSTPTFPMCYDVRQPQAGGLGPVQFYVPDASYLQGLLLLVTTEHDLLEPRIADLETILPPKRLDSSAYLASKERPTWTFSLEECVAVAPLQPDTEPKPAHRNADELVVPPTTCTGEALKQVFADPKPILFVGAAAPGGTLETQMAARAGYSDIRVICGEGTVFGDASGRRIEKRPEAGSFYDWMARSSDADMASLSAYCLGVYAGRQDVALLRKRMLPDQVIIAEHGSVAASWLDVEWGGSVDRSTGMTIYSEPCRRFRLADPLETVDGDWPKISVVTVSYNQARYLEDCIKSVIGQNYPNLEYIIIDACSTDGSAEILERYRDQVDVLVIEPDGGQSDGLNKGFNLATGDYLTWVNSDDALAPLALRRAAAAFKASGADIVAGTCERIGASKDEVHFRHYCNLPMEQVCRLEPAQVLDWSHVWEKGDYFFQPEVLFSKDIWMRSGGAIKRHLYWAMDWDMWVRMAFAGATIVRIPDVIGCSRVHDEQKTQSDEAYLPQIQGLLDEYRQMFEALDARVQANASAKASGA